MAIDGFDHYTVRAADIDKAKHFYETVLGLRVEPRPGATIPAYLVFVGDQAFVHLFEATPDLQAIFDRFMPPDDEAAQWATRRLHHVALKASGLAGIRTRLSEAGAVFTERTLAAQEKHLIVVKDPDGVELELQFPASELTSA